MKRLKLNYGSNVTSLFEVDFIRGLNPIKDEVLVLVPEQFKAATEKYLIEELGRKGLFHVGVYGFSKLIEELSLSFGLQKSHLSRFGKTLILTRILKQLRPELELYRTRLSRGLIDHLLSLLDALRLEGISADELAKLSGSLMPTEGLLIKKTRELALIFRAYEEAMDKSHVDEIALTEALIEELLARPVVKDLNLIVEGFNGMSRQEMRLIAALSHHAGSSTFINILKSNEGVLKTYSDKFVDGLKQAFYDIGDWEFQIEEVLASEDAKNKRAGLFSKLFSPKREKVEVEGLEIVECDNREDEIGFIALDILKKMREEGAKWSDFALISNSLDAYQKHIFKLLREYKIPYFIDDKMGASDLHFCAFLISALEAVKTGFSQRAVIRLLKHYSHLQLPREKLGLEDYERAYEEGVGAYFNAYARLEIYFKKYSIDHSMCLNPKYLRPFFLSLSRGEGEEGEDEVSKEIRIMTLGLLKKLSALDKSLREADDFGDFLSALQTFIEEIKLLDNLKKLKSLYLNLNEELRLRSLNAEEIAIEEVLSQFEMLGIIDVSDGHEFIDLVLSALKDYELSLPPPSVDTIVIGTAARSRLLGIKYLYLIGSNEGLLPSKAPSNVFFSENEMVKLEGLSFSALKRGKNFMDKEVFDIFEKIAFAEKAVIFTYTRHDEKNEEIGPSYWLKSLMKQGKIEKRVIDSIGLREIAGSGITDKYLDSLLLEGGYELGSEFFKSLDLNQEGLSALKGHLELYEQSGRDMEAGLSEANGQKFREVLNNISVSKLEDHANCPYRFFVNYILRPREMPRGILDKRDLGSMMHGAYEDFVQEYLDSENRGEFKTRALTVFYHILEERVKKEAHYKYNEFERKKLELARGYFEFVIPVLLKHFDTDYLSEVRCEYNIREEREGFELRGKVDRLDVFDIAGTRYFRVIDYKSSDKAFDLEKFCSGLQIQLPLYLSHFVRGKSEFGEGRPLGFAYSNFGEKLLDNVDIAKGYDEAKVRENYMLRGKFLGDVTIFSHMEKSLLQSRGSNLVKSVRLLSKENKWDGRFLASLFMTQDFDRLFQSLDLIVSQLSASLASANIEIRPRKLKKDVACTYCNFKNICKFDGVRYRPLYKTEPLIPMWDLRR